MSKFMSNRNRTKGFTLIELLVVIAIIGILSSVVLASLNTARNKGNNAKIKAQLSGLRAGAEVHYDIAASYAGLCASTDDAVEPYLTSANYPSSPTITCADNAAAYIVSVPLATPEGASTYWCIDSFGNSKGRVGVGGAAGTQC
jgi:prepilin-type N-terminal cleavage/methylation domain-containing protein